MNKNRLIIPALFMISLTFLSFNFQNKEVKLEGLYKLLSINDNKLPAHPEEENERITLSGAIFFSSDGMWAAFLKEKESENSKTISFNLLEGTFKLKNGTVSLFDETLDDNYVGKISGNEILIISKYNGKDYSYLFRKVDLDKL